MKTDIHFWWYLAEFLLQKEMLQIQFVENIKTHFVSSVTFSRKSPRLWDKCGVTGQATDDNNIRRIQFKCRMCKARIQPNIYSFSTITIVTRTHLHVTLINTHPGVVKFYLDKFKSPKGSIVWCLQELLHYILWLTEV